MASFNVKKGGGFQIKKSITQVVIGCGWDVSARTGETFDLDTHALACTHEAGSPSFYNEGSHALTYANQDLVKGANKSFATSDGSMQHLGDNRNGKGDGDDEQISLALSRIPNEVAEIMLFVTVHEARARRQNFSRVQNAFVRVVDADTQAELCRYDLGAEFGECITLQVGSLVRENAGWTFKAVGAGFKQEELGEILEKLS